MVAALWLAVGFGGTHADAAPPEAGPISVPPLKGGLAPVFSVRAWNGGVVADVSEADPKTRTLRTHIVALDLKKAKTRPLEIPGCVVPVAVAEDETRRCALCEEARRYRLVSRSAGAPDWSAEPLKYQRPPRYPQPRLVARSGAVAVVGCDVVEWRPAKEAFRTVRMKPPKGIGCAKHGVFAEGEGKLYLGFDAGEFGGGLFVAELAAKETLKLDRIAETDVTGMVLAADGGVWVSGGLAHMGGYEASLIRLKGGAATLVVESGRSTGLPRTSQLASVPKDWHFEGIHVGQDGGVFVVVPPAGIARLGESGFVIDLPAKLDVLYRHAGYRFSPSPLGVYVTATGDFVVPTFTMGVLVFSKSNGRVNVVQIVP